MIGHSQKNTKILTDR